MTDDDRGMTDDDRGGDPPESRDKQRLARDLEFSVWCAIAGVGTAHGGRRAAGHLKSDLARSVAPKALAHMLDRGWQFRHRSWPKGDFIGDPDGTSPARTMGNHMPLRE